MPIAAAIQMCSSNNIDENLQDATALIQQAAKHGATLVVLPEMFAFMDADNPLQLIEEPGHGKIQSFLADQARKQSIWLVGGTLPLACKNRNKARAATLVYNDKGELAARYDKIHLFDVTLSSQEAYRESDTFEPGHSLCILDTPIGQLGLGICYDLRFPELFRCLHQQGAEVIALPAAFTAVTGKAHWELLTRSRAIENFAYLIGAAQGGTHARGRQTHGNSLIVDPWGTILARQIDNKPGVIYAEIDLNKQREIRRSIPIDRHQKIYFDLSRLTGG